MKEFRIPFKPEVKDRKELFAALNEFVRARHGWLTSVAGEREVTMECLPCSALPEELRENGYVLEPDGEGQRILTNAITQQFAMGTGGELELVTAGSTRPISTTVTHAGIVPVHRFTYSPALRARCTAPNGLDADA
jgi:hypothetical protein